MPSPPLTGVVGVAEALADALVSLLEAPLDEPLDDEDEDDEFFFDNLKLRQDTEGCHQDLRDPQADTDARSNDQDSQTTNDPPPFTAFPSWLIPSRSGPSRVFFRRLRGNMTWHIVVTACDTVWVGVPTQLRTSESGLTMRRTGVPTLTH